MTTEELIAFVKQRNFCGTCTTRPEGCDSCERKIAKDMILSSLQGQMKAEDSFLLGTWEFPDEIPTDIDSKIVPCIVIVQGVQTGTIRLEEAEYRYGEWDISNAWNLVAWRRYTPGAGRDKTVRKPLTKEKIGPLTVAMLRGIRGKCSKPDGANQKALTTGKIAIVLQCGECKHWNPTGSYGGDTIEDMEPLGGCKYATTCMRASDFCSHGAPNAPSEGSAGKCDSGRTESCGTGSPVAPVQQDKRDKL